VAWTLADLAGVLTLDELGQAAHEAWFKHRVGAPAVDAVLARRPNLPGRKNLLQVMHGEQGVTLSYLERRFVAMLRRERLPLPVTNRPAGGRFVDCRWPVLRVTVELDSYGAHATRHAWEKDRAREREAYARGDQFRRFTYGDVLEHPRQMLGELRGLLLDRGAPIR
jgi:hypothetical protein